jgi:putative ATP-binding cassette transporter
LSTIQRLPKDAWSLARPYFWSEERWSARAKLAGIVALSLALVGMDVVLSYWGRAFYNALQQKDWDSFIALLLTYKQDENGFLPGFIGLAVVYITASIYTTYLNQWLQISWREWITGRLLQDWLAERAYYAISLRAVSDPGTTDNPDQRIAEDLRDYVTQTLSLSLNLLSTIVTLFSFVTILWTLSGPVSVLGITIPGYMVWAALVYSAIGTALVHLIGRPLVNLNFRHQKVEADFRFSLVRVRENAEAIALSAGETAERGRLGLQFAAIRDNWRAIMTRTKLLNSLVAGFSQISSIFPVIVAAPRYFGGSLDFGGLTQTIGAFGSVQGAMSWFVGAYREIAVLRATVDRILSFRADIDIARASQQSMHIQATQGDSYALTDTDLLLPNGQVLLKGGALIIQRGQSTAITGRSGSGKSTLFRALAGIWPFGSGTITPGAGTSMFLPQRPYFPIGTLREAICYPTPALTHDTASIAQALIATGLASLKDQLDTRDNWGQRLSGGEQQRLALTRALLARPDWLFLDEATASLDPASEQQVLQALRTELPNTTIISIVHRPEVAALFPRQVTFHRDDNAAGQIVDITAK